MPATSMRGTSQGAANVQSRDQLRRVEDESNTNNSSDDSDDSNDEDNEHLKPISQLLATKAQTLNESIRQASEEAANKTEDTATNEPPKLSGIDARIAEFAGNIRYIRQQPRHADTLVFVGRLCLENKRIEDDLVEYFTRYPLLVESSRLKALNSPYFDKYLGPFYVTRRWKSLMPQVSEYILPFEKGKKFILNLTPDTEGSEALQAIQDLSCPPGVLTWKESVARWRNSALLVEGVEENDTSRGSDSIPQEYSRVRQVKSIERFLLALQGQDPGFDTAAKVYTTVMVTKPWEIQGSHPLTNWTLAWLCAEANVKFVQALPETALKMSEVLRSGPLCRDAFGILVGEAVLAYATGHTDQKKTVHERVRGDVEENWQDRIQHARNSFMERIRKTFDDLAGEEMIWVETLYLVKEIKKVAASQNLLTKFDVYLKKLKQFIRGSIYQMLSQGYSSMSEVWQESGSTKGDNLYPRTAGTRAWPDLGPQQRIYTSWFWILLNKCRYSDTPSPFSTNLNLIKTHFGGDSISTSCKALEDSSLMQSIKISELDEAAEACYGTKKSRYMSLMRHRQEELDSPKAARQSRKVQFSPGTTSHQTQPIRDSTSTLSGQQAPSHAWTGAVQLSQNAWDGPDPLGANLGRTTQIHQPIQFPATTFGTSGSDNLASAFPLCSYWYCPVRLVQSGQPSLCPACRNTFCSDHLSMKAHTCSNYNAVTDTHVDQFSHKHIVIRRDEEETSEPGTRSVDHEDDSADQTSISSMMNLLPEESSSESQVGSRAIPSTARSDYKEGLEHLLNDALTGYETLHGSTQRWGITTPTVHELLAVIVSYFKGVAGTMLEGVPGGNLETLASESHLVQTLMSLNEEETKYLPLWADGMDDGTGGVFSEQVPMADGAPVLGPGGSKYATRSEGSEYSFASSSIDSTVNTSTLGHDGYKDTLPRGKIVAIDDSDDSSIGGWSYIQEKINGGKGKQPAIYTPDESEVATTLGGLDDASIIDLGIKQTPSDTHESDEQYSLSSLPSTPQAMSIAQDDDDDALDDVFMNSDEEEADFDNSDDEESDLDLIQDEDLQTAGNGSAGSSSTAALKPDDDVIGSNAKRSSTPLPDRPRKKSNPRLAWELHDEAMTNVVYRYKGSDEDELMTRL